MWKMELSSGVSLEVNGAIFSKGLSHTLCGTTVLDEQCKVSTLFHAGSTYLFDQASVRIPSQWNILAKEEYDKATGLPFIDMKVKLQTGADKAAPRTTPILAVFQSQASPKRIFSFAPELRRSKQIILNRRLGLEINLNSMNEATANLARTHSDYPLTIAGQNLRLHAKLGHCGSRLAARTRGVSYGGA